VEGWFRLTKGRRRGGLNRMRSVIKALGVVVLIALVLSACDPIGYKFTGTIINSLDHKSLASVKVIGACEKSRLDPPVEVLSDDNGSFALNGYGSGALDDCQLTFEHPQFKSKVVKLQPARELKEDVPFMRIWTLSVELDPL
jgi:hypothetical protein